MLRIRVVTTASKSCAVQIIYYRNGKRIIYKHIGSAKMEEELHALKKAAQDFIDTQTPQLSLFSDNKVDNFLYLDKTSLLGVYYLYFYEQMSGLIKHIGFDKIFSDILLDLVIIRLFEPASKLRSIELINEYFGVKHRRQKYYESAPKWLDLKRQAEDCVLDYAKKKYSFKYDILFYDVTTLYFETFEEDDLRENGFSKDNKSQQPQILVALMVTKEGFPIAYEIFSGSTFEGHTILSVVEAFIKKNKIKEFTVVADAAMISKDNIIDLTKNQINYIVGARLGNLARDLIEHIDKSISREDGQSIRLKTENGYLICSFSSTRYRKDKYEMEKQIQRAISIVQNPGKNKKLKFTKSTNEKIELNEDLIEKTKKLLGLKGYYTNLEKTVASNQTIMDRYHELYKIEQAFRISKSDLKTRPVFHFKEQPIKLHILICFMALALSKHIELQTNVSIKKFTHELKKITDARLLNHITNREIKIRTQIPDFLITCFANLNLPH